MIWYIWCRLSHYHIELELNLCINNIALKIEIYSKVQWTEEAILQCQVFTTKGANFNFISFSIYQVFLILNKMYTLYPDSSTSTIISKAFPGAKGNGELSSFSASPHFCSSFVLRLITFESFSKLKRTSKWNAFSFALFKLMENL